MNALLLRLAGPMQSWGTRSRFTHRDTQREPSKSGVIGLVCAALGIPRDPAQAPPGKPRLEQLAALAMHVRVDAEGALARDYQTAGGGAFRGPSYGVYKASGAAPDTVVSNRYYLADAEFLVALQGDLHLLRTIHASLASPVWPLYLGRRSYVPGLPVHLPDGLFPGKDAQTVLRSYPLDSDRPQPQRPRRPEQRLRLVLECGPEDEGAQPRLDGPLSFQSDDRRFARRYVRMDYMDAPTLVGKEIAPCTSPD